MNEKLKILLIEDLPSDVSLAEHEIKKHFTDFSLHVVDNEADLITALETFHPDIILSDYALPGFDGMKALKIVQEKYPLIPFIMLTGSMNEETAVECMKAGAWDYVIKEHIRRLTSAMSHALKERELRLEKLKIEEENKFYYEKIKSIFNASSMGISHIQNRVILEVNDAVCHITGYSKEELIGRDTRFIYLNEEEYKRVGKTLYQKLDEVNAPAEIETRFRRKDGQIIDIFASASYLDYQNKDKGLIITIVDITNLKKTQEALKENERRYNSFIEANKDIMFIKDEEQRYLVVNKATEKFFNRTRDKIIGRTDYELMDAEYARICANSDKKVLEGNNVVVSIENINKRFYETTKFPIPLSDNKTGIGAIIRDVTEKQRNDLIMTVQYTIADAVIMAKSPQELYFIVKSVLHRLFDTTNFFVALYNPKNDMLSTPFARDEYDHISEWPAKDSLTGYLIKNKKPLLLKKKDIDELADKGFIKHIGSRSECWMGVPLINEGVAFGAMVTQNYHDPYAYNQSDLDVFEIIANQFSVYLTLKNAEEETKKLTTAIVQSPVVIVITDREGKIEYVNPKFTELTGYTFEESIGKNPRILKSGYHSREFYEELWHTILSGKIWQGEIQNKNKNGEYYWESVRISPIFSNEGKITHFIAVKEDITEKKKIIEDLIAAKEKAEESDRLKSSFLNNISHEIRTPLNGIIGFIELLTAPDTTMDELREYIDVIKDCGYQLIDVVTETINYSMIESGQEKAVKRRFDLSRMINQLQRQFNEKNRNPDITFIVENNVPEDEKEVLTDETKLRQIISNLLSNAFKFTDRGEVRLLCEKKDNELIFKVKDTGIGIASEYFDFIFEKFTKIETDKNILFRGTGLGLAICKAYTMLLDGKIWVESEPGKGSVFHLTIPVNQ